MHSKRSQIPSQIFIYVVAIILFSFVLVYGYNAVKGFREKGEQIAYIKFKTDLTSVVKRTSPDYDTLRREEFFLGGEYSRVCFVQSYKKEQQQEYDNILPEILQHPEHNPLIEDSFKNKVDKNVFLFTTTLQESFDVGAINTTDRYSCMDLTNGKVKLQFLGKGDHTFISEWGD